MTRALFLKLMTAGLAAGQTAPPLDFTCPMDPDIRARGPGKCPRCGMKLEARIQEPVPYRLRCSVAPANLPAGTPVELRFELIDPRTSRRATAFQIVHEKLFHLFLVSADLKFFLHDHPVLGHDGIFRFHITLPKPGIYKLLADCYPAGGTPQLLPKILTTAGYEKSIEESIVAPPEDREARQTRNLHVALRTEPRNPIPGTKTMLFFKVDPGEELEPYLGAMGHLLAASNDLVDSIHEHPFLAAKNGEVQFNIFFPRAAVYRVWAQFQSAGVVNTAQFTIPVRAL